MNNNEVLKYVEDSEILFKEWERSKGTVGAVEIDHSTGVFVKDGVVCPDEWFSQSIRPLFLLKEAHGGESDWDLINSYLLNEDYKTTNLWKRVSIWTKGIFNSTSEKIERFDNDDVDVKHFSNKYLRKIAVVNIKKSKGESSSQKDNIESYAKFDKARLKQQIEICDPTIIVCGYTASMLNMVMDVADASSGAYSYHIKVKGHDVLVLNYWHPANRYPDLMNYYGLMGIYQEALKNKDVLL